MIDRHEAYLDNAATTEPYPQVIGVITETMRDCYGNASARYDRGRACKSLLEKSRATVAEALGAEPREVYFTSGGTEANNLAIVGACRARKGIRETIVASALEHPSVAKTVRGLKREGWKAYYVPAEHGAYDMAALEGFLSSDTALITTMTVQNELGYRFPIVDIVQARNDFAPEALVHTDGVQAFGKVDFQPVAWGVDLASVSSHKIGGPIGVGALYVKADTHLFTNAFGGGQERGLRSGTEPVPLIAGFAEAVRITMAAREAAFANAQSLKHRLLEGLLRLCPDIIINSRDDGSPYIVSFSIPGVDNRKAMAYLNEQGIYVSKASACHELYPDVPPESWRQKHPQSLESAGVPTSMLNSTFRVSFSARSTDDDVMDFLQALEHHLATL